MTEDDLRIFRAMPPLLTERLALRRILPSDLADVYEYASNPETSRYLLWDPHPDLAYTRAYLRRVERFYRNGSFYDFAVTIRESGKMIGTCGFSSFDLPNNSGEIGYVLNPAFHRLGYGSEATARVIAFGFETLRLHRIYARYFPENAASRALAEKCGMTYEGCAKGAILYQGRYRDLAFSAITRD